MSSQPVAAPPSPFAAIKSVAPIGVMLYRKRLNELIETDLQMKIYGGLIALKFILLALVRLRVARKNDQTEVWDTVKGANGAKEKKKTNARDYDMAQVTKDLTGALFGVAIVVALYQWKKVAPILQIVQLPLELLDHKLIQMHLLGIQHPRPFPQSDFMSMLGLTPPGGPAELTPEEKKEMKAAKKAGKKGGSSVVITEADAKDGAKDDAKADAAAGDAAEEKKDQ